MIGAALLAFAACCLMVCTRLRSRRAAGLFAVAVFLFLALGVPLMEVGYKCLQATSEGCVWGKTLLTLSVAVGSVIGLVIGAGAYLMALGFQRRRRLASEAGLKGLKGRDGRESG